MTVRHIRLEEFCDFSGGGKLKLTKGDYVDVGFPAFSAAGQDGFVAQAEFDRPGIVVSSIGARCGKAFLASGEWTSLANTYCVLPDASVADAEFLWLQLNDEQSWQRSGTAQPFIKPRDIQRRVVHLPPLDEQRRIVDVLSRTSSLKRLAQQAQAKSDALVPALFMEMFGHPATNPKGLPSASLFDVVRDITSKVPAIQRRDYAAAGEIPIYDQGQKPIAGYSDESAKAYTARDEVVLFGDHTRVFRRATGTFYRGADGLKVLEPIEQASAPYLCWFWRIHGLPDHGYSRHFRFLKDVKVALPPREQQHLFGERLNEIESISRLAVAAAAVAERTSAALMSRLFAA